MSYRDNEIDFSLGTDSEYIMTNNNDDIVRAKDYVNIKDRFGRDGFAHIFEIKSYASKCPLKVVDSIKKIMQEGVNKNHIFAEFRWNSGSFVKNFPIASHVHVGIKKNIIDPYDLATQFLDHYICAISVLLENKKQGLARRNYKLSPNGNPVDYGFLGDVRIKNHKKLDRWEYRSCSSWLSSPRTIRTMLCLSKIVIYEALNNKGFAPKIYIEKEDVANMNQEKIRQQFDDIWQDISNMLLFPYYKDQLKPIPYLVRNKLTWDLKKDMKETWGIVY